MMIEFNTYKEQLFDSLFRKNYNKRFMGLLEKLYKKQYTKKEIYELFLKFHKEIQVDSRTINNETIYNLLSDFMDGFTDSGIGPKF